MTLPLQSAFKDVKHIITKFLWGLSFIIFRSITHFYFPLPSLFLCFSSCPFYLRLNFITRCIVHYDLSIELIRLILALMLFEEAVDGLAFFGNFWWGFKWMLYVFAFFWLMLFLCLIKYLLPMVLPLCDSYCISFKYS